MEIREEKKNINSFHFTSQWTFSQDAIGWKFWKKDILIFCLAEPSYVKGTVSWDSEWDEPMEQ
jgi:hypothetical protein